MKANKYIHSKNLKLGKASLALLLTRVSKREAPRSIWDLINEA